MTINDLPEESKEELRKILREDILHSYHSGNLGKELGEKVEDGLNDEEVLIKYDNEGCWSKQIIEGYLMRWEMRENSQKSAE